MKDISDNLQGIFWMLLAGLLFSAMVAMVKVLGGKIPSYEIVFFRSAVQVVSMMAFFWRVGFSALKTNRPVLQTIRAILAVILINCNFFAFTRLPIADVTAVGFSRNLFLVLLATSLLGERINIRRLLVTLSGFLGILLITRPGLGHHDIAIWFALAGAGFGAAMMILIRKLTFSDSNEVMMTYPPLAMVFCTSIPTIWNWVSPSLHDIALLVIMSFAGICGQWCMIQAFRLGEATAVAPASYIRIVFAVIIGVYFFAELPDIITIAGTIVIVASNLVLMNQERNAQKPSASVKS